MSLLARTLQRLVGNRTPQAPTHVVPLGLSCRVAYQVRTYFASPTAHPFDWWLSPIGGLTRYLEDPDPERVYGAGALAELTEDDRISTIVATEFGFQLFHEFPREEAGRSTRAVAADWRDQIAAARDRHARRLTRLLALDRPENRLLFVRDRLDVGEAVGGRACGDAVAELSRVLALRWPHAERVLLLINVPRPRGSPRLARLQSPRDVHRVDFDDIPGAPPETWRGDTPSWASAFARAGYARPISSGEAANAVGPPD